MGGPCTGTWILFYDKSILDEKWAAAKALVVQDLLGGLAKCSTAKSNPNATSSRSGIIIMSTSDYLDREEVYRSAILHKKTEYNRTMYYKRTDRHVQEHT